MPIPIIGITGSYSKTTTKNTLHQILKTQNEIFATKESFNNRLGIAKAINEDLKDSDEIAIIEMGRDDLEGKPEKMKEKIVEGRIAKRLKELALMEQPFIKDSSITVAELVKQAAGKIGENVKVRRFTR